MSIRTIKTALARLNREGGEAAAKKLILAVPYKRDGSPNTRDEIVAMIAAVLGESAAEVKAMLRGAAPGVLIRAEDYNSHPAEADLAMIGGGFEHAGEIVYPRPEDLRWSEAQIIDGNGELHPLDRWEEAVAGILYGSDGRRGSMYFTPARRAANGR